MTPARQPIRALPALLVVSSFYALPASAEEATGARAEREPSAAVPSVTPTAAPKARVAPGAPPRQGTARPKAPPGAKAADAGEPVAPLAPPEPPALETPKASPVSGAERAAKPPPGSWLRKSPARPQTSVASGSSEPSPIRMVALLLLVGSLGAAAWFRRRGSSKLSRAIRSDLTVVSAARVGNKAQVVIVNVGGRKLLLGVTEAEVSSLAWLDAAAEPSNAELGDAEGLEGAPRPEEAPARALPVESRHNPSATAPGLAPRRFSELLFNALGQGEPRATQANTLVDSPAMQIAESTRDLVTRTPAGGQRGTVGPRVASPAGAPEMVDIEGQARGLVLRLQKRA